MKKLEGKVALVTASTRGIGYAIAETFAREGAIVYMACRNLEVANEKAAALNAEGCTVKTVYFEAYDRESCYNMVKTAVDNEGRLDILVNNFGGTSPMNDFDIYKTDYQTFQNYVDVHLQTVFVASQAAINLAMAPQKSGCIINTGSVAGLTPDVSQIAYGTSKGALVHMTKIMATHVAKDNIRVNMVAPGMTATEAVMNNLTPEFMEFFLKHTPIRRMATAQEMADAVALDLVSKRLVTDQLVLTVGYDIESLTNQEIRVKYQGSVTTDHYGRQVPKHAHGTVNLDRHTSSTKQIMEAVTSLYDRIVNPDLLIRRLTLATNHVISEDSARKTGMAPVQLDLFTDYEALQKQQKADEEAQAKERRMQETLLSIKNKYGKNSILRGLNFEEGATAIERNKQIGGHKA